MDKAIYFMLQAIFCEMQSQRIALGEAERTALQEKAELAEMFADVACDAALRINREDEPPPASE
jgi:hypothetical protein